MKKIRLLLASLVIAGFAFQACEDMDDTAVPVNDFIWKGLNLYYLWQEDVPNLADDRFDNQEQLNDFLEAYQTPDQLFFSLLYKYREVDRFSAIVSDFRVLENTLQGVTKSNGIEYGLVYENGSDLNVFGYVRYILPGSDAEAKGVQRGDIFYAVDGIQLTDENAGSLLRWGADTYTLSFADFNGGDIEPNGEEVSLTKSEYAEDPVYKVSVHTVGAKKVGYFMYNGFYSNYDNELNAAIGQLAAEGIDELVLDLRYNSGGSVRTATYLGSMITGDHTGEVFAQQQWNSKLQSYYEANNPEALLNKFSDELSNGQAINKLHLERVFILTTISTASASEMVINGLKSYIDVIQIGETTIGKNVGSVTLYDSPNFGRENRNGSHRYAMQPIVLRIANADGEGEYTTGIAPTVELDEDYGNMGVLGDPDEPYFAAALDIIDGRSRKSSGFGNKFKHFKDSKSIQRFGTEMYIEEMPEGSLNLLKDLQ